MVYSPGSDDFIENIIDDILRTEGWNQLKLASEIGVTQSAISRWISGASIPRQSNRIRLLEIHLQARYHHWDIDRLEPICAIAESYPSTLRDQARAALAEVLNSTPADSRRPNIWGVDVHMFAARLPKSVYAYTFANDPLTPNVFVVLVQERLNFNERRRWGWDEVYAHVSHYPRVREADGRSQHAGLLVSSPLIRHFSAGKTADGLINGRNRV